MHNIEILQKKLQIDEHALEKALKEHPDLVYNVGQMYALSISERDGSKLKLDEIIAEVDSEIREDAAAAEEKVTEKAVEGRVKADDRVKKANQAFLDLKLKADQIGVLKEAYNQRSYALSKLVDLYISNYYSEIEGKGSGDYKTVQAHRVKKELSGRRRVDLGE